VRIIDNDTYEAELASAGVCGGFVVDTVAGSVRLPKWHYQAPLGETLPVRGNGITLGLTDGTTDYGVVKSTPGGSFSFVPSVNALGKAPGYVVPANSTETSFTNGTVFGVSENADNSGLVAENNAPTDHFVWCIQVYNATTALSEQESAQLASEMQMKAQTDLANVTNPAQAFKDMVITWSLPNYAAGVDVTSTYASGYTAPEDGWIYATQRREDVYTVFCINGSIIENGGGSGFDRTSCFAPIKKGQVITVHKGVSNNDSSIGDVIDKVNHMIFYPME
jgi:hypothetical protein